MNILSKQYECFQNKILYNLMNELINDFGYDQPTKIFYLAKRFENNFKQFLKNK